MLDLLPMKDTVAVQLEDGYDDWGNAIPLDPVEYRAYVRYNTTSEKIAGINGDEVVYNANVYLPYNSIVTYESKVTFEDSLGEKVTKTPIRIQYKKDFWGGPQILRVVV